MTRSVSQRLELGEQRHARKTGILRDWPRPSGRKNKSRNAARALRAFRAIGKRMASLPVDHYGRRIAEHLLRRAVDDE